LEDRLEEPVERVCDATAVRVRSSLGLLANSAPEEARVLHERFMRGRELQELAAALGVSVPTACRRVQAALVRLRGCMSLVLS
jgi:DNA-directed RNA polymerase specialized sigma24 family protein